MASEQTLHSAIVLFNSPEFRRQRAEEFPRTIPEYDARAATFAAMDAEGRFDSPTRRMSEDEQREFDTISRAVIQMSGEL